jgi:hypothetical protein
MHPSSPATVPGQSMSEAHGARRCRNAEGIRAYRTAAPIITENPLLSQVVMSEDTPRVMWYPMTTTLVLGFTRSVKHRHQKWPRAIVWAHSQIIWV